MLLVAMIKNCSGIKHWVEILSERAFLSLCTCIFTRHYFIFIQLFSTFRAFLFLRKNTLHKNRVSGTVLMFQLMLNFPTCTYITSDSRKKIPSIVVIHYCAWYLFSRIRRYLQQVVYKNTVENSSHIISWRLKVAQTVVLKRKFSVKKDVAFGNYAVLNFRFLAFAISQNFLWAFKLWQLESLKIISWNLIKFIDIKEKLIYFKYVCIY